MVEVLHNLHSMASLDIIRYHLRDNFNNSFLNYVFDKASLLQCTVFSCLFISRLKCRCFSFDIMTGRLHKKCCGVFFLK